MTLSSATAALLADARIRAEQVLAAADADASERTERARREAREIIDHAVHLGEAQGRSAAARDAAVERSVARMSVLAAQREACDELRRRVRAAALAWRADPAYPELLERLCAAARRDLGDGADIERDVPGSGGVRARAGTRLVDYTLISVADRCMSALGPRLASLWR